MLTLIAMVYTFVSKEGVVWDVAEDRDSLAAFAVGRLIDGREHLTNVDELLKPARSTKQLNFWTPLSKLRWIKQINSAQSELQRAAHVRARAHAPPAAPSSAHSPADGRQQDHGVLLRPGGASGAACNLAQIQAGVRPATWRTTQQQATTTVQRCAPPLPQPPRLHPPGAQAQGQRGTRCGSLLRAAHCAHAGVLPRRVTQRRPLPSVPSPAAPSLAARCCSLSSRRSRRSARACPR